MLKGILFAAALVGGIILIGQLIKWAGRRGYVYTKEHPRPPGKGLGAMDLASLYQPSIEYAAEEIRSEQARAEDSESGQDRGHGSDLTQRDARD